MRHKRSTARLAAALASAGLGACAARPAEEPAAQFDNVYLGDKPVYVVLDRRGDGQWTFDRVTTVSSEPHDGFLVRLNDLAPAFDTRLAECEPRPYRENDRCNPLHPFRDKDMGVVGKIMDTGISAGTGGKIDSISRSYTTRFDRLAFNKAVDEALLTTGLDEGRRPLISGLTRLAEITERHNVEISGLAERMIRDYEHDREENIVLDLRVTGLKEYYSYDIDPNEFVHVRGGTPGYTEFKSEAGIGELLPCEASRCVAKINETIRTLEQEHGEHKRALRARLGEATSSYSVDCTATEFAGYHFELSCPERLQRTAGEVIMLPVEMKIHSRDYADLYPHFREVDENISATVDENELILENLTDDFVDVQSISLYYNSKIHTIRDAGADMDLAPRQRTSHPLNELSSTAIEIEARHANMTPDKASRTSFRFGLAVKYSLRDRNAVETIYAVDEFDVECAIENRLRPGTCTRRKGREDPVADSGPATTG